MNNTPKDCKCGAKYVTGLRSAENGQMVDANNQFTCFRCYNEEDAARLRAEDAAMRCTVCGGPGTRNLDSAGAHRNKDNCITYLQVLLDERRVA
jgi:hypothetical protein